MNLPTTNPGSLRELFYETRDQLERFVIVLDAHE
jgi:hypothetical protein